MMSDQKQDVFWGLLVFSVAFLAYANSLSNGFVWDDNIVILNNPLIKGDFKSVFANIDRCRESELNPYYRPLTFLTFIFEHRLHHLNPFFVHFLNVSLHSANAVLVYLSVRSLKVQKMVALMTALLFAVHPIHSESVNFIAGGRNTLLATFFILATYLIHRWSIRNDKIYGAVLAGVLFFAGLLSKETALMALCLVIFLEFNYLRENGAVTYVGVFVRSLPYVAFLLIYFVLRGNALAAAGVKLSVFSGLLDRLQNTIYIFPRYFLSLLCPTFVSSKYYLPDFNSYALPIFVAWGIMFLASMWIVGYGRGRLTTIGVCWFFLFWLPVSGIVAIPSDPMADRYLYVPVIGLWLVLSDQLFRISTRSSKLVVVAPVRVVLSVVIIALLAGLTVKRNIVWKNDVSLFSKLNEQYPDKAFGHHNLGVAYMDQEKNLDLAEREFDVALSLDPYFPLLRTQMGYARFLRGDYEGALVNYDHAVMLNPLDVEAHLNRGVVLERLYRYDDALHEYQRFLAIPGTYLSESRPAIEARVKELLVLRQNN